MIVVARGGGSLADLFAFCDETLCRTVAMLRVPVVSSVGHHSDRTLIDDVAAVACSTPTHAAEAAVPLDCAAARTALHAHAARLDRHGRRAIVERARVLARLSRAPGHHVARQRAWLHQKLRELRASSGRALAAGERPTRAAPPRWPATRAPPRSTVRADASSSTSRSRSPPTTRSGPWSAATRSSRARTASRSPAPPWRQRRPS